MNSRTLKPVYPQIPLEGYTPESTNKRILNGTQLLSIHLALHRPVSEEDSDDPNFGPYLTTLPREFDAHPLSWLIRKELGIAGAEELDLLQNLPPSVLANVEAVGKRYRNDWDTARLCVVRRISEVMVLCLSTLVE